MYGLKVHYTVGFDDGRKCQRRASEASELNEIFFKSEKKNLTYSFD